MHAFSYHRARTVTEAVQQVGASDAAAFLAGGMTLIPALKLRLAAPSLLVDVGSLGALRAITAERDLVTIGALASHASVAESPVVQERLPAVAALAAGIGDAQVRNRGTIGGSLANNDPATDYPAAVLALAATIHTDRRAIAADAFFIGMFETALASDELITAIAFRRPRRAAYVKFSRPGSGYALAGVFVAETADGPRVAVTGAGPCVFRVPEIEAALATRFAPDAIAEDAVAPDDLISDLHASAEYRAHLVSVVARRAIAAAVAAPLRQTL
ncbi:MAG: xanthine dehydrogenase family protein subunit M [Rhodospirillales bacterium]|nr:xanthine dehydrogenase family protein subunit M [Rhodospirillales bacterium]